MCLGPEVLAGLALSGAGTYLQAREQAANAKRGMQAKNAAFVGNINRNRQFSDEAGAQLNRNVQQQGRENFDQQKEQSAVKMEQLFNDRRVQPDYNTGFASNVPKNVVLARQAASEDAASQTDRDVGNLSNLQGYSGSLFNSGLSQNEFARLFGNIQDKAGANTRLLPLEMNAAYNNSQKAPSLFPTLLKAAGTATSLYGGAGGSFSAPIQGPTLAGQSSLGNMYGLFMDGKPVQAFGYNLAGRLPFG